MNELEISKFYERHEDMSRHGKLQLFIEPDGDIIISVIPDQDNFQSPFSVQFCTVGSGGGKSPNVRKALINLIEAIEKDNKENPINR